MNLYNNPASKQGFTIPDQRVKNLFFIDGIESCPLSIIEETSHMTHHGIEIITSHCFQYFVLMAL